MAKDSLETNKNKTFLVTGLTAIRYIVSVAMNKLFSSFSHSSRIRNKGNKKLGLAESVGKQANAQQKKVLMYRQQEMDVSISLSHLHQIFRIITIRDQQLDKTVLTFLIFPAVQLHH